MTTNFFKFKKSQRIFSEQPVDKLTWAKHGVSEFFGTIMISLFLAGLSTVISSSNGKIVEEYMVHPILVGFYAGFIAVGIVLIIFLRWSCDLNPAVTIYRMITARNTYKYGFYKLGIQFIGGIVAGLIIYGDGSLVGFHGSLDAATGKIVADPNGHLVANHAIDAVGSAKKAFFYDAVKKNYSVAEGAGIIFLIEMVMTSVLLFPIFSPAISNKYRDLMICFVISMSVWMGLLGGTAAINPARGLAQQVPGLFFGYEAGNSASWDSLVGATVAMIFGGAFAPFFLCTVQELSVKFINPWLSYAIEFKNFRGEHMDQPNNVEHKAQHWTKDITAKTPEQIVVADIAHHEEEIRKELEKKKLWRLKNRKKKKIEDTQKK